VPDAAGAGTPEEDTMKVPFRCVLCPTDLSPIGNLAAPVAYRLAGEGAVVHLAHVCEPPFLGNPLYTQFVQGYVPTPEEIEAGEERVRQALHRLPPENALELGIRTEYHHPHDISVADVIERLAREVEADVVVLATRGRTGLGRLMMGSVASDVVKKEGLPVILVHQDLSEG
jgi:nucleotide-binding universal stress UspA family protein